MLAGSFSFSRWIALHCHTGLELTTAEQTTMCLCVPIEKHIFCLVDKYTLKNKNITEIICIEREFQFEEPIYFGKIN